MWCSSKGCSKISQSCQTGTALTRCISFGDDNQLHYKFGNPWIFYSYFYCPSYSRSPLSKHGWDEKTKQDAITLLTRIVFFRTQSGLMDPLFGWGGVGLTCGLCIITNFAQNSRTGVRREVKGDWFGGHEGRGVVRGWSLSVTFVGSRFGSCVGVMTSDARPAYLMTLF
jgi:hypothetical protein